MFEAFVVILREKNTVHLFQILHYKHSVISLSSKNALPPYVFCYFLNFTNFHGAHKQREELL